jgi:hypothetical protein
VEIFAIFYGFEISVKFAFFLRQTQKVQGHNNLIGTFGVKHKATAEK